MNKNIFTYPDGRMDAASAALYLGLNTKTLDNWRCYGRGPEHIKLGGRIFYFKEDLDAFIERCKFKSSTEARIKRRIGGL